MAADERFANIQNDPRFRLPSKKSGRVTLDQRFSRILHDKDFAGNAKVDRYGRRLPKDKARKDLAKFYKLESEDDATAATAEEDQDEVGEGIVPGERRHTVQDASLVENEDSQNGLSESSSSDDSSSESDSEVSEEEVFGLLQREDAAASDSVPTGEVSSRLAVVNLDWDNIRATDLMAVFSSFVPAYGRISNIAIYPSEFGKARMSQEELEGPPKDIFLSKKPRDDADRVGMLDDSEVNVESDQESAEENEAHGRKQKGTKGRAIEESDSGQSDSEDSGSSQSEDASIEDIKKSIVQEDSGIDFNSAKLRRYQLERLRYFYAVITCTSSQVAQHIYDAVDGTEYLTTANFFDLRYIPEGMDFADDRPRDECTKIPVKYRPNDFVTDALQHSKVKLTWDMDDGERKEAQKRAFQGSRKEIDENDLKAYLGSDSSEEEDRAETINFDGRKGDVRAELQGGTDGSKDAPKAQSKKELEARRVRALLGLSADAKRETPKENGNGHVIGDMQITFSSGLSTTDDKARSVFENTPAEANETTAEKYIRKEKERKARRRERARKARDGDAAEDENGSAAVAVASQTDEKVDQEGDLGFDDPFFTNEKPEKASKIDKKSARRKEREARMISDTAECEKLEPLLHGSDNDARMNHFDINALARAEKSAAKLVGKSSRRRNRLTERDKDALAMKAKDTFQMNVKDPRFADVYDKAEYAIDPSHPRYMPTGAMQELMDQRRKKRQRDGEDEGVNGSRSSQAPKRSSGLPNDVDVDNLVHKLKKKSGR